MCINHFFYWFYFTVILQRERESGQDKLSSNASGVSFLFCPVNNNTMCSWYIHGVTIRFLNSE